MASSATKELKRKIHARSKPSGTTCCYLTRGTSEHELYAWNISTATLVMQKGDFLLTRLVPACFYGDATSRTARVLQNLTVPGRSSMTCVLERHISFQVPIDDLQTMAPQVDLENLCTSKGIECASFLEHYVQNPQDEEMQLGSLVCSLFVATVEEMLSRKYDIMHHYPLFNRALGLYYSDKMTSEPPELNDVIAAGGLLDRSVQDHQSIHGISVVGNDCASFSQWNYFDKREEQECPRERPHDRADPASNCDDEMRAETAADSVVRHSATQKDFRSPVLPRTEDKRERETLSVGVLIGAYNNLPGTLTDRPMAFPYMFTVQTSNELKFDDLVNYCLTRTHRPVGTLPSRDKWGSVNPVLLMQDPIDPATGKTTRRYTITSRGHLSSIVADREAMHSLCYNEVFLPDRPVSRLNLDVDLKCCQKCNKRFSTEAERTVKCKVSEALAMSLILAIAESLLRLTKVTKSELEGDPFLRDLAKSLGKIGVYFRASSTKSKLSLRMLWYLPVELCSFQGIEAYKSLLDELEKVSLSYVLLSYPADSTSCGLCDLACAMKKKGAVKSSTYLRFSGHVENRSSCIDKAPYSFRKSVRLPNCYKDGSSFEYVDTFNAQEIEDPGLDDPLSLSVGLSSNPILIDVTSLGSRFRGVLRARGHKETMSLVSGLEREPDRARVESEARRLALLWGVPVTIRKTGSGLFCVQESVKSSSYPCPIHNRVHSKSKLGALIFATHSQPKCFVP